MTRRRWGSGVIVAVFAGAMLASFARRVDAGSPEGAPAVCRAQVARAVGALAPALAECARVRKLAKGDKGTLEHAILAYAPPRFHPVEEGTLPAPRAPAPTCPPEMALVGQRFCVDRYEATLVEVEGGIEKAHSPYHPPEAGHRYFARSARGVVPQAYISASQASEACEAAGKRLCQPVEWRAACGGSEALAFPYGPARVAGKCHDTGKSPMLELHAATMNRGWGLPELNDPRNNQLDGTLAKTGTFADCVNDYGVYDMVGNLHEWTADPNGTFQGGYWLDTSQHGDGCAYRTIAHGYGYRDYSTGFRCCLADPASVPAP